MAYLSPLEQSKLFLVRPDVITKGFRVMQRLEAETGERSYIISGYRSLSQQTQTWKDSLAQGFRASPPDTSRHPLGAAIDVGILGHVHDNAAVDQADPLYAVLARIAGEEGLVAGYNFKGDKPDPYHLEADEPLELSRARWAELTRRRLWRALGIGGGIALLAGAAYLHRRRHAS